MTLSMFGPQRLELKLADDVPVLLVEGWLPKPEADAMFTALRGGIQWQQESFPNGASVPLPRLTAWFGDQPYLYSGIMNKPMPWPPMLEDLRDRVSAEVGHSFSSCLGNMYRDGKDAVGWHADDERGLEPDPIIASVSLGAPRRFVMRHPTAPKVGFDLGEGALLVMGRGCQRHWQHSVPRQADAGPRISLTFRRMA